MELKRVPELLNSIDNNLILLKKNFSHLVMTIVCC